MALKNPKGKGNAFERVVAKMLSEAFNRPFKRVPSSGARTGGRNTKHSFKMDERQRNTARGDIIPPDSFSYLVIECKHRACFTRIPLSILTQSWRELDEALQQVVGDCTSGSDTPLLFIKGGGTRIMAVAPLQYFSHVHRPNLNTLLYRLNGNERFPLWLLFDAEVALTRKDCRFVIAMQEPPLSDMLLKVELAKYEGISND